MADKEQTNDSLKNSDKNFNENCTHNKEQIMIDGVDISGCEFIDEWKHCDICNSLIKTVYPNATKCLTEQDLRCETYQNCHYKQLARKTQECEDLKERLERTEEDLKYQCVDCMNVKSDRYRKALDEIEEYIKKYECDNCENFTFECGDCGTPRDILNIISEAKGEE